MDSERGTSAERGAGNAGYGGGSFGGGYGGGDGADANREAQRSMAAAGISNLGGDFGTGIGRAMEGNAFAKFVGLHPQFNGYKPREASVSNRFDPTRSGLIGLGLSAVNPALGGLYGMQRGIREGNPIGGVLSGVAGLAGGMAPFNPGAQMLGGMSGLNQMSGMVGGPTLDSLARSGGPRPTGPVQPGMGGENDQHRMARLLMMQQPA